MSPFARKRTREKSASVPRCGLRVAPEAYGRAEIPGKQYIALSGAENAATNPSLGTILPAVFRR
jgi:hypothetical protein